MRDATTNIAHKQLNTEKLRKQGLVHDLAWLTKQMDEGQVLPSDQIWMVRNKGGIQYW